MSIKNCMRTPKWGFTAATSESLPDRQPGDTFFEALRVWNNPLSAAVIRRGQAVLAEATGCRRGTLHLPAIFRLDRPLIAHHAPLFLAFPRRTLRVACFANCSGWRLGLHQRE